MEPVPSWTIARGAAGSRSLVRADGGGAVRLATVVRVAYDGARLEVRFDCVDPDPWSTFERRDDPLWEQEVVELFLAPGDDDPRRYVEIEVSPRGVPFDAVVDNPDGDRATLRVDAAWDCAGLGVEVGRGRAGEGTGWWAELSVPLDPVRDALGATAACRTWRANFYRIDRPRDGGVDEFSAWSPTGRRPPDFHVPSRFGRLRLDG